MVARKAFRHALLSEWNSLRCASLEGALCAAARLVLRTSANAYDDE